MKPTEKQKQFLKQIELIVEYFKTTNDINSSSHCTNISDVVDDLKDKVNISDADVDNFNIACYAILDGVRSIEH